MDTIPSDLVDADSAAFFSGAVVSLAREFFLTSSLSSETTNMLSLHSEMGFFRVALAVVVEEVVCAVGARASHSWMCAPGE